MESITKKRPYATKIQRDIQHHEDVKESGLQGGKVIGEHLPLVSFVIGIPLLLVGCFALINMYYEMGIETNMATIILALLITIIGSLMTIGGYFLYKGD